MTITPSMSEHDDHGPGCDGPLNCTCGGPTMESLLVALREEADKPESVAIRAEARRRAEQEFLADVDAEAPLTVEHARAGDRVEVVTGAGFLWVTIDYVMAGRPGWAKVHYHHESGFTFERSLPYDHPVERPTADVEGRAS